MSQNVKLGIKYRYQIGRGLEADGILAGAAKARWRLEKQKKILRNEKYIGDTLLQKTYTVDFLTKKRVQNNGIVPQYYVENSHKHIIPRDLYMQVQEEMVRRANLHSGAKRKKRVYSSKYALPSIVYCPKCGEIYRRIAWNNRGKHSTVWRCCTRVEHGPEACDVPTIQEFDLQEAVVKAINLALGSRDDMMATLQKNIETVLLQGDETSVEGINAKLKELQKELLRLANAKKEYGSVAEEIERLRDLKQKALTESAEREGLKRHIAEMREFLETRPAEISEYDELLVRRLIEKVTVYDERFEMEFKSGATVDVER
ncbi:recombinase family protein [Extibacter muris]|uniref:recombinase family protein n=1 Tax=Extibacter muris TaxID=1796622 RepID=UPI0029C9FE66|nr:recombinase family protein [Extibacter muris]